MPTSALMSFPRFFRDNGYHQTREISLRNFTATRLTLRLFNGLMSGLSGCHGYHSIQPGGGKPGFLPQGIIAPSLANSLKRTGSIRSLSVL